ncbi:MAG: hypothetical protein ACOVN0_07495 [Niveispirillum sp.]
METLGLACSVHPTQARQRRWSILAASAFSLTGAGRQALFDDPPRR